MFPISFTSVERQQGAGVRQDWSSAEVLDVEAAPALLMELLTLRLSQPFCCLRVSWIFMDSDEVLHVKVKEQSLSQRISDQRAAQNHQMSRS